MQSLPGFRDFLPNDCATRNYIFDRWREVARRYGFVEWDGPVLEPTDLYRKKSGAEIVDQLFNFVDKGEREVALRPELTPTLARVVAAHEREFKKPIKWFSIGQFFRYEKQQRGRLREHFQLNCDIIGEESIDADVEIIALAIDLLRALGLTAEDFAVRLSDRETWTVFLDGCLVPRDQIPDFLSIIDKLDRVGEERTKRRVEEEFKIPWDNVKVMLENPLGGPKEVSIRLDTVFNKLADRGLEKFIQLDCSLVRGLAYYTGTVFEIFDRGRKLRAIAGGGRYDNLIAQLSDGAVKLPALGFAMGDVVLSELIGEHAAALEKMEAAANEARRVDIYVVIAKEERRTDVVAQIQELRDAGYRVDYPLTPAKVGKQFQTAEQLGARLAVLFGDEWPQLKLKDLRTGEQSLVPHEELSKRVATLLSPRA
jgi:histidyl-tRNA synthetase